MKVVMSPDAFMRTHVGPCTSMGMQQLRLSRHAVMQAPAQECAQAPTAVSTTAVHSEARADHVASTGKQLLLRALLANCYIPMQQKRVTAHTVHPPRSRKPLQT
jgi:hypothetical protein